eukprot:CAMPEP_0180643384 /NCGR_PEP_ID=MMETSP1037_2-20121125/47782_1 /TAXON_ID=632150 /ORGANISM="Azadinium spinosum, Strain 3D9" /LENGTH=128 /DNA_ID=CAMNT_0022666881 /DNA_START=64 /DNA_END=450 /DNA_ORIENTATION=+
MAAEGGNGAKSRARGCSVAALGPPHWKTAAPQLSPAPKPAQATTSPGFTRPCSTASVNANGMLPAEVLPYSSRFAMSFPDGILSFCATDSMMRMLAWCSSSQSTSSIVMQALQRASRTTSGTRVTAKL